MHAQREWRLGAVLVAGGCLPFAAGALMTAPGEGSGLGLPCPFRAATGLPCPLCGATRAFALAARGDADLVRYNAAWVALAALAVLAGLLALGAAAAGRAPVSAARARLARSPVAVTLLVAGVAWAYALAQRGAITGY